jgi:hypothetical protein
VGIKKGRDNHKKHNRTKNKVRRQIKSIKILYTNANGLSNKTLSLQAISETHESHIIAIAETKVQTGDPPSLENYEWHHRGRQHRGGEA